MRSYVRSTQLWTVPFNVVIVAILFLSPATSTAVDFSWSTVGGAGNAPDTTVMVCCVGLTGTTGYGSVGYDYSIAQYEVTNSQYAEFLNAVADADPNEVYKPNMAGVGGGISRSGVPGSYSYLPIVGRENRPATWVSFWSATRFANWMHNGQPIGPQGNATTEDGAYTLTPPAIANFSVSRNAGATVFIPSVDEWYKAAYYNVAMATYYNFPGGSDTATACSTPTTTPFRANCSESDVFDVGSYPSTASPNGTFDQGGNVMEWNDDNLGTSHHVMNGGSFLNSTSSWLNAKHLDTGQSANAWTPANGFRVASLATPLTPVPSISPLGLVLLSTLMGLSGWRRLRG